LKTSSFLGFFGVATGFAGMAASIFCTSCGETAPEQFVSSGKQQKAESAI